MDSPSEGLLSRPALRTLRLWLWRIALPGCLLLGGCVSEPSAVTGEKQSFGYSWEQELQLGAEADQEITAEMGLYESPALQTYVESVGNRVLSASGLSGPETPEMYRNTNFTFRLLDSPVVNAFALPGGYVYVTRGLLSHMQNEAQLAVVLGHEVAHVLARHSSQQARRAQMGQIGLIAGAILGQQVLGDQAGNMGQLLNLGQQAFGLFMMRYSREAEYESDNLGITYAKRAGYDAGESAAFFQALQRINESEGRALPTWQSTHPDPGDRASRVQEIAARVSTSTGQPPVDGQEQFLTLVNGMVVGDDPREGFTRNGVFYHPGLRFQFPVAPGWKVENQKAAVVMGDPNGRALMALRTAQGASARAAADQFASGGEVQVVARGDTQVNGLPASTVIAQANTEQGAVGVWNTFVEYEGRVYSFLGYSGAQVFNQVRPTFETVAAGFRPLQDMSLLNVQPARLKVVRADRDAPFASFVPTNLPPEMTAEQVAIMNQVRLDETVGAGRLLKIPDMSGAVATGSPAVAPYPAPGYPQPVPNPAPAGQNYPGGTPQPQYPQSTPAPYPPAGTYPPAGAPNFPQAGSQNPPAGNPAPSQTPAYPAGTYPAPGSSGANFPTAPTYPPAGSTTPTSAPGQYPAPSFPR